MKAIVYPNLPSKKAALAAVSCTAGELAEKIREYGVEICLVPSLAYLPLGISSHSDIQLLPVGRGTLFYCAEQVFDKSVLDLFPQKIPVSITDGSYPHDSVLNAAVVGNNVICNSRVIAPQVLSELMHFGYNIINVKQGYSKCSVCVLSDNAIITDDIGIYKAAQNVINDVTFVSKNSVLLEGFNYGFIGGCCGKISADTIVFNGSIESHKDANIIIDSLARNGLNAVELPHKRLEDIGGIIPLAEID